MSIVITNVETNGITMVADTAVSGSCLSYVSATGKIISNDAVAVGIVGDAQHLTIMEMFLREHPQIEPSKHEVYNFLAKYHEHLSDMSLEVDVEETDFHVITQGTAWFISGLLIEPIIDIHAIGCGRDMAMGALEMEADPEQAVRIVCRYNQHCEPPIDVVTMHPFETSSNKGHTIRRKRIE